MEIMDESMTGCAWAMHCEIPAYIIKELVAGASDISTMAFKSRGAGGPFLAESVAFGE